MTNPTPRELIQRLTGALSELRDLIPAIMEGSYEPDSFTLQPLESAIQEVSIALAQPEPVAPTDEELIEMWHSSDWFNEGATPREFISIARAALARWGRPAIQPIPAAERPWEREGWCDAEGRCWWGRPSEELCNSDWFLATRAEVEEFCDGCLPAVSLPHHALPIPTTNTETDD